MDFKTSVSTVLRKYVVFSGRARRSEYWWYVLFEVIVSAVARLLDSGLFDTKSGSTGPIALIVALGLFLPSLAVTVRRLHDGGRSGWWILIGLIPLIGAVVLIVFLVKDSVPDNEHGPSPKGSTPAGFYGAGPEAPRPAV
ncbi:hypothetical protein ASD62_11975 [Phycicoccus sp. Root563]|uniref:DUF805 domain-containing protein n=1 Tax=Phycicoccus sp. Root563 TaxID=1736562 RepID=UPI0007039B98|nr:DUF805 domain-containing protein [Phycicoccus sp. Root563]KQZ89910.1 hypothetical protein ASD62_11975 [Phycicoccus sp. Root563]